MKRIIKAVRALLTRRIVFTFDKVDFVCSHVTWKRYFNWVLSELAYVLKSPVVPAYPTHLQIEPSTECNLRCPLCLYVTDYKPRGLLEFDHFRQIMDDVGRYILFLHFWGWGEPFKNPDFFKMVKYAKSMGLQIISSTNGHFFEDEDNTDRLLESGLDVLIVALDGVDRKTYEKYRKEGDFDRVIHGIRTLIEKRNQRHSSTPRINIRMLVTKDNENQIDAVKALAGRLQADIFSLKTLYSFNDKADWWEDLLPCDSAYRRFRYDETGRRLPLEKNPCRKPWNHPTIYRDGIVVPCDYYTGNEYHAGRIFSAQGGGFKKVWFGREFRRFRRRFLRGDHKGLRCSTCPLNFADVDRFVSHAFLFNHGTIVSGKNHTNTPAVRKGRN